MTGSQINAVDAVHLGLADRAIASHRRDELAEKLIGATWGDHENTDAQGVVNRTLRELEHASKSYRP